MSKAFDITVQVYADSEEDYDRIVDDVMSVKGVDGTSGPQWAVIPEDEQA